MKRWLLLLAAGAMIFSSCAKDLGAQEQSKKINLRITARAQEQDSKTELSGAGVIWSSTDRLKVLETVGEMTAAATSSESPSITDGKANFDVSFYSRSGSKFLYNAIYPHTAWWDNERNKQDLSNVELILPTIQKPTASSFDPASDILIAKPIESASQLNAVEMQFSRTVALGEMYLTNIASSADVVAVRIQAVDKTMSNGKYFDLSTGLSTGSYYKSKDYIELDYRGGQINASDFTVYFNTWPFEYDEDGVLKVEVITSDGYLFSRDVNIAASKHFRFDRNKISPFSVNMSSASKSRAEFVKVTTEPKDWTGQYLIVCEESSLAFDSSLNKLDAGMNNIAVSINSAKISASNIASAFTIAKNDDGGYSIKSASGYYIGNTGTSNALHSSTTTIYQNTISIDGSGNAVIQGAGGYVLRYNNLSGDTNQRFRYYNNTQQAIQLYRLGFSYEEGTDGSSGTETGVDSGMASHSDYLELPAISPEHRNAREYYLRADSERNYTAYYDTDTYSSLWVAYPLAAGYLGSGRDDNWKAYDGISKDLQINVWTSSYGVEYPSLTNYYSGNPSNYFARGHQIPNADRNGNATMQGQTFIAINSTPQIQNSFNSGVWSDLENALRSAIPASDTLYVVTGPVYQTVGNSETIRMISPKNDTKQCPVPNYYFKAVLKVKRSGKTITSAKAVGFWYEHRPQSGSVENFAVSVDEIESRTGFNLFANLPAEIAASAEQNSSWEEFRRE